jgi:exodeoxyribonuclease VII small subunit
MSSMAEVPERPESFEASLDLLEKVVKELETGDLPLERSIELFQKGMDLSQACRKQLSDAETRVEALFKRQGKVEVAPFELEEGDSSSR